MQRDGSRPQDIVSALRHAAEQHSDKIAFRLLRTAEGEASISFGELNRRVSVLSSYLRARANRGDRVLLVYPHGFDFIIAFMACMDAALIPVPGYPPRNEAHARRLAAVRKDCEASMILSVACSEPEIQLFKSEADGDRVLIEFTDAPLGDGYTAPASGPVSSETAAFIQYTSGSTGSPKGVVVTHSNLVANQEALRQAGRHSNTTNFCTWLPHFHDMGLIANILHPIYLGASCTTMSPASFLQRPLRWLEAISRYRANTSGAPSFAYDLCVRHAAQGLKELDIDLSTWDVAFNGAEPISAEVLDRFAQTFEPYGFRREAFFPCYGLAESTLFVTGNDKGRLPTELSLDADALELNRIEDNPGPDRARRLVGSGKPAKHHDVVIVDPSTRRRVENNSIGEIWVCGPSVAAGYWNMKPETAETFQVRLADADNRNFLRTGDLGFLRDDNLFVTGRIKDLIIIRGRNYYPQDLESAAEASHPALRAGGSAAFTVGEEDPKLVLVLEVVRRWTNANMVEELVRSVSRSISNAFDLHADRVVLIKPNSIPKTTSGKIQRRECRNLFLARRLQELPAGSQRTEQKHTIALEMSREMLTAMPVDTRIRAIAKFLRDTVTGDTRRNDRDERLGLTLPECGIDSLMASQLQALLRARLKLEWPITRFLSDTPIESLAADAVAEIEETPWTGFHEESGGSATAGQVAHNQEGLWFIWQVERDNAAYNIGCAIGLAAETDIALLVSCVGKLIERHSALRSAFLATASGIRRKPAALRPAVRTLVLGLPADQEQVIKDIAREPFDLENGPLFRAAIVRSDANSTLMLAAHHIAVDMRSLELLIEELWSEYHASGTAAAADDAEIDALVARRRNLVATERGIELESFWLSKLGGDLPALALPSNRSRVTGMPSTGGKVQVQVDSDITSRLFSLARCERTSAFCVVLALFSTFLSRHTGQNDITVGIPTLGRTMPGEEAAIGHFVNPVVARLAVDDDVTFRSFVKSVRVHLIELLEHQDYPFQKLVARRNPDRQANRNPLFQAMLVWRKATLKLAHPFVQLADPQIDVGASQFDLSLAGLEWDGQISLSLEYSAHLFDEATVKRLARNFEILLEQALSSPDSTLGELDMLCEAEKNIQGRLWNSTEFPLRREASLQKMFQERVNFAPSDVAVIWGDEKISASELNRRANQVAHALSKKGVSRGSLVGLLMERTPELVIAILGVLKAGGAYLPIEPTFPHDRIEFMLEDAKPQAVLTQTHLGAALVGCSAKILYIDDGELAGEPDRDPDFAGDPEDLAYVIYTSGSTGRPKGVMCTHVATMNRLDWMWRHYEFTPKDVIAFKTPFSFDVSVWEILLPLLYGAVMVVARPEGHKDCKYISRLVSKHQVTAIHFVPSMLSLILEESEFEHLVSLRCVFCSGEALSGRLRDQFFSRSRSQLHNLYGPTEAAIDVSYFACTPQQNDASVPIGQPISNVQLYILDRKFRPLPLGAVGELFIGGICLAQGYLNRPELTRERFIVANPFSRGPQRLYRTGDAVRYLPDGNIAFLGRLDFQVKIRGQRVELNEIESVVLNDGAIQECAVIFRPDLGVGGQLICYIVMRSGKKPADAKQHRGRLAAELPDYMVPNHFVVIPFMPLNSNGKVDRAALPTPVSHIIEDSPEATDEIEKTVSSIWCDILGVPAVPLDTNFFEAGGNSLALLSVQQALRNRLNFEIPVVKLLQHTTVRSIAAHLRTSGAGSDLDRNAARRAALRRKALGIRTATR